MLPTHLNLDELLDDLAQRIAAKIQPSARQERRLLTLQQAGERIGRSAGAVGQLVKRGELRGVECGRRVHIEVSEINGWIDRCTTDALISGAASAKVRSAKAKAQKGK